MTALRRNVRQTQIRLGISDWLSALGWCLLGASVVWAIVVLTDKLFDWGLPWLHICMGLMGLSLLSSFIWARFQKKDELTAAALLDEAAGLKERTSSGLYCLDSHDPFARAVAQDAESFSQRISVRSFIRYRWPPSLSIAVVSLLIAIGVSFLPISPLQAGEESVSSQDRDEQILKSEVKRTKRRLQSFKDRAEKNAALTDLKEQLKTIDELPVEKLDSPTNIRREAIKKIDKLSDALKKKRDDKFNKLKELKRMFRGLKAKQQPRTPTEKLSKALAKGDFKAAQDAIKELQEQLAIMKKMQDPEKQKELQKRLEELSKKLAEAAKQNQRKQQLQKELEKSGIDAETAKRALENLTKQDIQKIIKEMKKNGASDQQAKEMAKKLKAMQVASKQGSDLSDAMQQAAQAMKSDAGMADVAALLEQAGDQLNSMEQMQQELGELDSMLADAQDMKNDFSGSQCDKCGGKGCSSCGGTGRKGPGMGRLGQGRGGRADEQETGVRFNKVRTPVHTTKGSIIGKKFVDGEQIRGGVATEAMELITAAERDATDAINKNAIPNQYRGAIKEYFSRLRREFEDRMKSQKDDVDSNDRGDSEKTDD